MIGTQDINARKIKNPGKQQYCACGEPKLRGKYCNDCKVKAMVETKERQKIRAKEARK